MNNSDNSFKTPKEIREAIKRGDINEVRKTIDDNKAWLNLMTPFGTWLHVASAHGQLEIVKYLIESGLDVNTTGGTFKTGALERAATKGHLAIVKYLLEVGAEIDVSEPDKNPLFAAIYGGHKEVVEFLVDKNIDITITYTGNTMKNMDAYAFAIERGETEIALYLKDKLQR